MSQPNIVANPCSLGLATASSSAWPGVSSSKCWKPPNLFLAADPPSSNSLLCLCVSWLFLNRPSCASSSAWRIGLTQLVYERARSLQTDPEEAEAHLLSEVIEILQTPPLTSPSKHLLDFSISIPSKEARARSIWRPEKVQCPLPSRGRLLPDHDWQARQSLATRDSLTQRKTKNTWSHFWPQNAVTCNHTSSQNQYVSKMRAYSCNIGRKNISCRQPRKGYSYSMRMTCISPAYQQLKLKSVVL